MPFLISVALLAPTLLLVAGALKVVDPATTSGALAALGLPSSPLVVRVAAGFEVALGAAALAVGGAAVWTLVAASYGLFALFVVAAMRAGTMVGSCGCFGREDTPPHWSHVVLNLVLAVAVVGVAGTAPGAAFSALRWDDGEGGVVVALSALALYLVHAAFVQLPRTLLAARAVRPRR